MRNLLLISGLCVLISGTAFVQKTDRERDGLKEPVKSTPGGRSRSGADQTGNEMAVVYGDPGKAGELYAVRFRFADGFKIPAHWHAQDEHATVLQGTLRLGMGKEWDATKLRLASHGGDEDG